MKEIITLAHGSGGKLSQKLIKEIFHKHFKNNLLLQNGDAAVFESKASKLSFSTDSYVITPYMFKGGNIGKLAVYGTINDIAVSGAKPLYLSCGFIIEEGLSIDVLEEIVKSMAEATNTAGVAIVTGDTKVVQRGACDGIFINTSGIGEVIEGVDIHPSRIEENDVVIISGTIGDHGTAIMLEREGFPIKSEITSDCAPLNKMLNELAISLKENVHVMRDPTRGGVATTLNEIVEDSKFGIKLYEDRLPIKNEVVGVCEMLGLDPLYIANEGKALVIVKKEFENEALQILRRSEFGVDSQVIGEVVKEYSGKVFLETITGGKRIVDMLTGDQLPRIC